MSKKFIAGLALGLGIPAIASGIVFGVPSIRERVLHRPDNSEYVQQIEELEKSNTSLTKENEDLKSENTSLKQNNLTYVGRIESLSSELTTAKSSIKLKDDEITSKENQIKIITQEKELIQKDLDRYKELAGSDVNYIELVNSLQIQLEEKTNSLTSANAELEQLKVDKTSLETRVEELSTELTQVKEELANYKSLEEIEKLNISNFNGTWYLNGTFADYYTINNGIVSHNADEDKGLLNSINNQMYLMMNTAGGKGVTLSDDGTQFVTEDGNTYSKFYINTIRTVANTYSFCGTYSHATSEIVLNTDNTTTMSDGTNKYNGAYTVLSTEKNVGGNITIYNKITATYQVNGEAVVKEFIYNSSTNVLYDDNYSYELLYPMSGFILSGSASNQFAPEDSGNYLKIIMKTHKKITINSGSYTKIKWVSFGNYQIFNTYFNNCRSSSSDGILAYNATSENVTTDLFEFYISSTASIANWNTYMISSLFFYGEKVEADIIFIENCGFEIEKYPLYGNLKIAYDQYCKTNNYLTCNSVLDYIVGTYASENTSVVLAEDNATVNEITATSYNIVASTDGTDIYQTVTINYVTTVDEEDTTHILILKLKNEILISSLLDNEEIALIKSN